MFDLNCSGVIDLLEEVTIKAPEYIEKVLKVFDDFEEIKAQLVHIPRAVFSNIHHRFAIIIRNRAIRYATRETNKSFDEIAEIYDRVITEDKILAACHDTECDIPHPDANFTEAAKRFNWLKIGQVVFKIFMALLPFLMMAAGTTTQGIQLPQSLEELRALYIQRNTKIQSTPRMFISPTDKQIFAATTNTILKEDIFATKILQECSNTKEGT